MADLGTDNFDQEFTLGLIENEEEEVRLINEAITKIDDGTYGLCESCSQPIPKSRLKALPFAKLCIACKEKEETSR
jgi:DnaK suppressor protein